MWPCTPNREWKKYMMGAIEYIMWHRIYIIDSQQGLLKYVHRNHASWLGWLHRCWARWGPLWLRGGGGIEKRNKFDLISCHEFYLASTVGFCWKLLGVPFRANRLKQKKKRFAALLWRTFMVLLSIGGWSLPSKRGWKRAALVPLL